MSSTDGPTLTIENIANERPDRAKLRERIKNPERMQSKNNGESPERAIPNAENAESNRIIHLNERDKLGRNMSGIGTLELRQDKPKIRGEDPE